MQQQVADFQEVRFRRQLVDRIAAVQQHACVAVDVGQRRFARRRRGEAGIEGEGARTRIKLADVDDVRAGGARKDRKLDGLVLEGQGRRAGGFGLFSHECPFASYVQARGGVGRFGLWVSLSLLQRIIQAPETFVAAKSG